MAIIELYSKRQKRLRGDVPDVYIYDSIPHQLKTQIAYIWDDALGSRKHYQDYVGRVRGTYEWVVKALCREYGIRCLDQENRFMEDYYKELRAFFLNNNDIECDLDVVELTFKVINQVTRDYNYFIDHVFDERVDAAISELNYRFKEHGIGYQFEDKLIRVDSQLVHQEAVKPALQLLSSKDYSGPQEEFLSAFGHYRHGNHKEALNDALKALESTMKVVCTKQGWKFKESDTASKLLDICYQNDLIPSFWQNHMTGLRAVLEGGVPTGRNKKSAHGQGQTPTTVPDFLASYVLHMTASTIVFLVKAEENI